MDHPAFADFPMPDWTEARVGDRLEGTYREANFHENRVRERSAVFSTEVIQRQQKLVWIKIHVQGKVAGRIEPITKDFLLPMEADRRPPPGATFGKLSVADVKLDDRSIRCGRRDFDRRAGDGPLLQECRSGEAPLYLTDGIVFKTEQAGGGTGASIEVTRMARGTEASTPKPIDGLPVLSGPGAWFRVVAGGTLALYEVQGTWGSVQTATTTCSLAKDESIATDSPDVMFVNGRWYRCNRVAADRRLLSMVEFLGVLVSRLDEVLDAGSGALPANPPDAPRVVETLSARYVERRVQEFADAAKAGCWPKRPAARCLAKLEVRQDGAVGAASVSCRKAPAKVSRCFAGELRKLSFPPQSQRQPEFEAEFVIEP